MSQYGYLVDKDGEVIPSTARVVAGEQLAPPPINVLAQAGNASATVQWRGNRAGAATSWLVTASPGGATVTVPATGANGSAAFPAGSISNGVATSFTVQAVNGAGPGRPSLPSNVVVPTSLPASVLPVTRGLEFWWSSAQVAGVSNGASLSQLTDMSGNGYHFAANNGGGTWVSSWSGGKPAVALNGSSQFYDALATGYFAGMRGPAMSVFALFDSVAQPASIGYVLSAIRPNANAGSLNQGFGLGVKLGSASTSNVIVMDNLPDYLNAGSASVAGAANLAWGTPIRATLTAPGVLRVNGAAASGILNPRLYAGPGAQPWTVGCMYGGGFNFYLQGRLAELIVTSVIYTAAEIAAMETYLATRS